MLPGTPESASNSPLLRFVLRTTDTPPAEVMLAVGGERDCIVDSDQGQAVRFFEKEGRLYCEPISGVSGLLRNGRPIQGPVELRNLDRLDAGPEQAFEVLLEAPQAQDQSVRVAAVRWLPWLAAVAALVWGLSRSPGPSRGLGGSPGPSPLGGPSPRLFSASPTPPPATPFSVPAFRAELREVALVPLSEVAESGEDWWCQLGAEVGAAALSPDGFVLAAGCGDGSVHLLDARDGSARAVLSGHEDSVSAAAWIPGTTYLLSAGYDGRVLLWDTATGWLLRVVTRDPAPIRALAVSPEGRTAATGGVSGAFTLWDLQSGRELRWWPAHLGMVNALAFTADGARLLSGSSDGAVRVWSAADGRRMGEFRPHRSAVNALAAMPVGEGVVSGGDGFVAGRGGLLRATDSPTATLLPLGGSAPRPLHHGEWVLAVAVVEDPPRVLVGTGGPPSAEISAPPGRLLAFDRDSGVLAATIEFAPQGVSAIATGREAVFVAGRDGWVRRIPLARLER